MLLWVGGFAVQYLRDLRSWPPLLLGASIVAIKRVDWAPGLGVMILIMIVGAVADWVNRRRPWVSGRILAGVSLVFLLGSWVALFLDWNGAIHTNRHPVILDDRPIVCVGDSLAARGFPGKLAERLAVPVVDLSRAGITATEGRERLVEALKLRPQAVVIELGGHDFLKSRSRQETRAELEAMILESRAVGAEVILFEIPRGVVMDGYGGLERELARKHDIEVIPDGAIRQLIFFSPLTPLGWTGRKLSNDGLHPNERGHAFMADRVGDALRRVFGDGIVRDP